MGSRKQSWSILIFGYNERDTLPTVVQKSRQVLSKVAGPQREILIVDDGSTDGSVEVIRRLQKTGKDIRAILHPKNLGIGRALRSGYSAARYENICAIPADGQFDPRELLPFPRLGPGTFVSFFRKRQAGYSLYRRALSAFNRLLNEVLLGYNLEDVNWVKIYKRRELQSLDLRLQSSLIESEICAKLILKGNTFIQSPSLYHRRVAGRSRGGGLKTVFQALVEILKLTAVVWGFGRSLPGAERLRRP